MILAVNTGSDKNSIALFWPKIISKEVNWTSSRNQSKELLPAIDDFLVKNEIKLKDLKAIAVFQGPGSYTGLRVGITIANTLAKSLNIPVLGIKNKTILSSLEIAKLSYKSLKNNELKTFSKPIYPIYDSRL